MNDRQHSGVLHVYSYKVRERRPASAIKAVGSNYSKVPSFAGNPAPRLRYGQLLPPSGQRWRQILIFLVCVGLSSQAALEVRCEAMNICYMFFAAK